MDMRYIDQALKDIDREGAKLTADYNGLYEQSAKISQKMRDIDRKRSVIHDSAAKLMQLKENYAFDNAKEAKSG